MKRLLLRHWLGASLLGTVVLVGCNQAPRRTVQYTPRTPSMVMMPAPATPVATLPVPAPAPAPQPVVAPPTTLPPVVLEQEKKPLVEEKEKVAVEEKPVLPAEYAVPITGGKEETIKRRTFNDITATSAFNHSSDYGSLTGELQYVHVRKTWCVRYASSDEEDRYGGKVTLIETGPMTGYSDGQIVRVEGQLSNADSHEPAPTFRVRSIQAVSHQ